MDISLFFSFAAHPKSKRVHKKRRKREMANKSVFASIKGRLLPKADAQNAHAAPAYAYRDAHALAQVAVTGTFGEMVYQTSEDSLRATCQLAEAVDPVFLAQAAVYARQSGYMKDMPAVLMAVLARRSFAACFPEWSTTAKCCAPLFRSFDQVKRGASHWGLRPKPWYKIG